MTLETSNYLKSNLEKIKERKPLSEKISVSRYDMFTLLNNNKVDFHDFHDWLEELIKESRER